MKKIAEILKKGWPGRVDKPEPRAKVYTPEIKFCKEQAAINIQKLRSNFDNKQAILTEKGAILIRVTNISASMSQLVIMAQAEEVKTPGLPVWLSPRTQFARKPQTFGAGYLTAFGDHYWAMGYGGWQLFFEPTLIAEVVRLAGSLPPELSLLERYQRIMDTVYAQPSIMMEGWSYVFALIADPETVRVG